MIIEQLVKSEVETKQQRYNALLKQIRSLVYNEDNLIINLTNIAAILHRGMNFTWTGFYLVTNKDLVLGPFQGSAARRRISVDEGALSIAYFKECTIIVDDVEQLPKCLPSNELDRSEIVLPAFKKGEIALLLNIGSNKVRNFDETDQKNLQQVIHLIEEIL